MLYVSKPVRLLISTLAIYIILRFCQRLATVILIKNYYRLEASEIAELHLTNQEKEILYRYANERKLAEQQVKLNSDVSDVHSHLRGGNDNELIIRSNQPNEGEILAFEQYIANFIFAIVDKYVKDPFQRQWIKSMLIWVHKTRAVQFIEFAVAAVSFIIGLFMRIEAHTFCAWAYEASPNLHILPNENFMKNLEESLVNQDLDLKSLTCDYRFTYADQMLTLLNITEKTLEKLINDVICDDPDLNTDAKYIQCIACLIALTRSLFEKRNDKPVQYIFDRVIQLVQSGRMTKSVAMMYSNVLISYFLPAPYFKLPKYPAAVKPKLVSSYKTKTQLQKTQLQKIQKIIKGVRGGATISFALALPQNQISMDPFVVIHNYKLQILLQPKNQPKKFGKRFKIGQRLKKIKNSVKISLLYVAMGLSIILTPISTHDFKNFKNSGVCATETTLVVERKNYQRLQVGDKMLILNPLEKGEKLTIVRKRRVKAKMVKFSDLPRLPESFYSEDNSTFIQQNENSKIRIKTK